MSKNTFIFIIILFLSLTKSSKYENDYIIESITYNEHRTSVSVNIKYNKSPSEFSLAEYDLEKPRLKASIKLIESLIFEFSIKCDKIFQFTIRDSKNERSEPEYFLNENMENEFNTIGKKLNLDDIGFTLANINEPFYFNLKDKSGNIYYHFDGANFLYTDTLIIFDQLLTTGYIYGFGERNYDFNLDIGRYTIWGNDTTYTNRDRKDGGWNLMGHQPIGLHLTKYKKYLGLLFLNANCQDVVIDNINSKKNNKYQNLDINSFSHILRHITIGGIINYYITLGDTPEESILGLHSIYGHPTLPPFWGLGWHQCRWGYKNTGQLREVRQNYLSNDIPLDALWTDIDMMDQKRNFILGRSFSDVPDFIKYLHNNGQHFIPLVDYGIPKKSYDPYYKMGLNSNAFLYSNFTKEFLISDVWPGQSVFPDFFINEGIELWKSGLNDYDKQLNFDGMWIDMNEPAMIGGHRGDLAEIVDSSQVTKDKNIYLDIPYLPGEGPLHTSLSHNTISVNAYSRKNDPKNNFYTMYNVKSLISKIQIKITNEYLNSVDKRPFIVSRANTIGHGKYAFHWLGDNISTFEMLRWSISGIFNYNIFGVPFSGADICGFHHSSTDELCARWHILGSFYPFSRNHNVDTGLPQEPWEFNSRSRFEDRNDNNRPIEGYTLHAAKVGIKMRYSLMRYAYSQFMLISLGKKGAYFKPAFFEFPEDDTLLNDMEIQNTHIMVGDSIYFIPCLNREQSDYRGYFPNANFNSIVDLKNILTYNKDNNSGSYIILNGGMTTINAFLLGGKIIPFQNTAKVLNSKDLRSTPISLIINPDQNNLANGYVMFDNDDKDVIKDNNYMSIYLKYEDYTLNFNLENNLKEKKYYYEDNKIESIILLRAKEFNIANSVTISTNLKNIDNEIIYEEMSDSLKIKFNEPYEIQNFKTITFKTTLQNNEAMNNVDQVIDNNQESKDKDKDKENNKEDNNKDINKENKDNKQKEDKKEQIKIKKNSSKLILVKILIFIIFVLLSAIIILFVKIKSLQKKKTSYIELAGLDSV